MKQSIVVYCYFESGTKAIKFEFLSSASHRMIHGQDMVDSGLVAKRDHQWILGNLNETETPHDQSCFGYNNLTN